MSINQNRHDPFIEDDPEAVGAAVDRASLRLPATLLLAGQLSYIAVTQFHAGGEANEHASIFTRYAGSGVWEAVHIGQFVATATLIAGLIALSGTARLGSVPTRWTSRLGAASALVALAMCGVLQAVDGVGNKQVDRAWLSAPGSERAARFATAEAMRWLEWGVRSYEDIALGLALLLISSAVARATVVPRTIAGLIGLSGLVYLIQGWVVGTEGFSAAHTTMILLAWAVSIGWMVWLASVAWRRQDTQRDG